MEDDDTVTLFCQNCGQRYRAGSIDALLYRSCLCGGILRAELSIDTKYVKTVEDKR